MPKYIIQARGYFRDWAEEYIDSDPSATTFSTREEAEEELENLISQQGYLRTKLRIIEEKEGNDE